jgi:Na+-transporting NADH:ubiquinone oxidoreductase subunit A
VESGLWTLFRTRPFSKVPALESNPSSFFVNACDTQPLAANPNIIIEAELDFFNQGIKLLDKLLNCHKFLCINSSFDQKIGAESGSFKKEVFSGPHPAGNTGTHIHFLQGVNEQKTAWTIGYQGVISIGKLLATGQLPADKIICLAGPNVDKPRLIRVALGACLSEVCQGNTLDYDELRVISGSILSGYDAGGPFNYLGQLHSQVTVLKEGKEREFFGWHSPGLNKFSATRAFLAHLFPSKKFNLTTNTNGSPRAIVPIGSYEKVMPLDIEPTFLLRSLVAHNSDLAQKLGCLELDEEDLALCSFVDPGKHDFGKYLRENLEQIEKEG